MKKFLTTPIGSIVKVYMSVLLGMIYADYKSNTLCLELVCLQTFLVGALFACFPMLINFFNPDYDGYGTKKEVKEAE